MGRDVDQAAAIVDALDMDTGRQHARLVDLVDLGQHALQGRHGLRAATHQNDALDDVVVVVLTRDAKARLVADGYGGHVGHQDGRAVVRGDQRVADVVHRADLADRAYDRRLRSDIHRVGADVDVGVVQAVEHLLEGEAVGEQPVEVDGDVERLRLAAPARDVDHAGDRLEAAFEHPVLDRLQVGDGVAGRADDTIAEDLADRAGRRQRRLDVVRQLADLGEPIDHVLRGLLVGQIVGELHLHVRQAEQRDRADGLHVGDAGHLDLDRDRDVALDLLGGLAGILGDDVDQRRNRVRIGLDVEGLVGEQAADHQHDAEDDHQDALLERGGDDGVHGTVFVGT